MREMTVNLDDLEQVDALCECIAERWSREYFDSWLRQHRTDEQIRADNAEAQRDRENEESTLGGPGR